MSDERSTPRRVIDRLAPHGSTARAGLRFGVQLARDARRVTPRLRAAWELAGRPASTEATYDHWLQRNRLQPGEALAQTARMLDDPIPGVVDFVVMPSLRRSGSEPMAETIEALLDQTAGSWTAAVLTGLGDDRVENADERVCAVDLAGRDPWVATAETLLDGDPNRLVVVLEAGDRPEPDLVFELLATSWDDPALRLLHWDDDVFVTPSAVGDPMIRPSWSPDILWSANYLGRSFAIRRRDLRSIGGIDASLGDASWWDLLFRLGLEFDDVFRLPRVLNHLSRRPAETNDVATSIVAAEVQRTGRTATVVPGEGGLRLEWRLDAPPHVTVIIPTRHNTELLSVCLPSLARTDYPSFDVQIVDNGGRSPETEQWYLDNDHGLDLDVIWWTDPFNYSRVNNVAAARARGDVLIFLNDDTEVVDPGWMREYVGWAIQPDIGLVGGQLLAGDGTIQHGGVILGAGGFADHLFIGLEPGARTMMGSTTWYRDTLSVTAACVAVRKALFDEIGGFDERFVLCGSDVVLGLDTWFMGLRNIVTANTTVRHLESVTRGRSVPASDFHASWWRYQKHLRGGDPYFSPSLSLTTGRPMFSGSGEQGPMPTVGSVIGRNFTVFRQKADENESLWLSRICRADDALVESVDELHARTDGWVDVESINWFFPDIDSPFYGGINTALRMADHLARTKGVRNRFVIMADPNPEFFRSALEAAFPALADSELVFIDDPLDPALASVGWADVSIATLWVTAYSVARFPNTRRKFYLIQDFEPQFYPAGTNFALTEEGYNLGLYGLCNTQRLLDIYQRDYGGRGGAFMPAVDQTVFHADGRRPLDHDGPVTVFVYARPGHWRNCWELASLALDEVKTRFGDGVRIVTAGSWARPDDLGTGIRHLGLLDYRDTGELYRTCDVGVALTVSAHPSYLPLELMSCGVPVVAFDNPAGDWIMRNDVNALRCRRTVDGLAGAISRLVSDPALRVRIGAAGRQTIDERFADWSATLDGIYPILADPDGWVGPATGSTFP